MNFKNYISLCALFLFLGNILVFAQNENNSIQFPIKKEDSKLYLENPIREEAIYDVKTGKYIVYKKVGNTIIGEPAYYSPQEYTKYVLEKKKEAYYRQKVKDLEIANKAKKSGSDAGLKTILPSIQVKSKLFETIFGGNKIEFVPQGFASIDLGILYQKIDNPLIIPRNRTNFTIDLQQRIQLSLLARVGNNLELKANYDTQAGFAFENRINLKWKPADLLKAPTLPRGVKQGEDRILRNIEFGNINMPLSTSLITGPQALFGVKTDLQFGKTAVTAVFSEQQSESKNIVVQNGGMVSTYSLNASEYEDNQHYYLAHFFRQNYDNWLTSYPLISSKINIIRMEVYKIDVGNSNLNEQRSLIAIRDLGESATNSSTTLPDNPIDNVFTNVSNIRNSTTDLATIETSLKSLNSTIDNKKYEQGEHFITNRKVRKLNTNEFYFNTQLGYISLNQRLTDDQLVAVSFQYTKNDTPGIVYKVGEFSEEVKSTVVAKLLKPNTQVKVSSPVWDLMMKNVYQLPSSQINQEQFFLNVFYRDPELGKVNYLPGQPETPLIRTLNWDRLNLNNDNSGKGDGIFDYMQNLTIFPERGKIIHTKEKPYAGNHIPEAYKFKELYTTLKQTASSSPLATRYTIEGRYQGVAGDGISLGAINVPRGSVRVTANGQALVEGVDYTVDYQLGRVKVINQTLTDSGVPINVSLENQSTFNIQKKRFWGINLEHKFSEKFSVGATYLNYQERPLTQKANYGVEAVNNSIAGMNIQYQNDAPFLTRFTDKIPGIQTSAPSNISFKAEAAYLIPGINNATNNESYIDDFEETSAKISLKDPNTWTLASKPELYEFDSEIENNTLPYGNRRALSSWYNIDTRFYGVGGSTPAGIDLNSVSNHKSRRINLAEISNRRDFVAGEQLFTNTFDFSIYPNEKGPYNVNPNSEIVGSRWAGAMRSINVTNFVQANVEYVEFWMMDPRADGDALGANPELKIHLGNVSEDVLKDGQQQYENGLPNSSAPDLKTTTSVWGKQPSNPAILYTFSTEGENRRIQDAGFDGVTERDEIALFGNTNSNPITGSDAAADDFVNYINGSWSTVNAPNINVKSVIDRYRYFRNPDGNSPSGSLDASSQTPDVEDLNNDYNLDTYENYNEYTIPLGANDIKLGSNNVVDEKEVDITFQNGEKSKVKWYLYRIPVKAYDGANGIGAKRGNDEILNNVRFIRIAAKGFTETSTLRFATFDLVRADWRRYDRDIAPKSTEGISYVEPINNNNLQIGSVNVEENSLGKPPYLVPPGIVREELANAGGVQSQNEASLFMKLQSLEKEDSRGVFKNMNLDLRRYKKLKMFVSAQNLDDINSNSYVVDNAKFFIRLGSDLSENYYEYEINLKYTKQSDNSIFAIWPEENTIDLAIQEFVKAKAKRDTESFSLLSRYDGYSTNDTNKKIYVKGRPSVGNITTVMMGVRNNSFAAKNLILWVNELRLGEIENEDGAGYAANANLAFNLADFAQVNATGQISTVGFGAIDSKPNQRSQEDMKQYTVNANINLDKFLPEKSGVKIPLTVTYGEKFVDPKFNPLENDVEFRNAPNKDKLKEVIRAYTEVRTIGINGLRKDRTGNKPQRFYDVENFTASILYSDTYFRDIYTAYNLTQNLTASLDYSYSFKPLTFSPFAKSKFITKSKYSKYLQLIKEININPIPARFSFRTDVQRLYNQFEFRDINALLDERITPNQTPIYNNNFVFGWQYNLGFNLTKSLKLDINSATQTLVDQLNNAGLPDDKLIWSNLIAAGRPVLYNHTIQLSYKLPTQFIPYMDFINAEVGYTGNYNWQARSTVLTQGNDNIGNIAQNSNTKLLNASFDFSRLYKKFGVFKKIDIVKDGRAKEKDSLMRKYEEDFTKKNINGKKFTSKYKYKLYQYPLVLLSSIKRGQINFTENNGTLLPGYLAKPDFFGRGVINGASFGPTTGFLLGSQTDIRNQAIQNGWITSSDLLNDPFTTTKNQQLTGTLQIEPHKSFRIDLNFNRSLQQTTSQFQYNLNNPIRPFENTTETYSISTVNLSTSFTDSEQIYQNLLTNARAISSRLGSNFVDVNNDGYNDGYGIANADVLIPAFESAISGRNANSSSLDYKREIPLPNWKITYTGLMNVPWIAKRFQKVDFTHSYISTYSVGGVQSNLNYYNAQLPNTQPDITNPDPLNHLKDKNGNFYTKNTFGSVVVLEGFNPLIGVDLTLRNSMQLRFQYNKDRLTSLSMSNFTINEELGSEFIFGLGYILKDIQLNMKFRGNPTTIKSDLNIRADISIRDTKTNLRRIVEDDSQITGGQNLVSVRFASDYNFSKNINVKLFYDQNITKYKISTAFPLSTIRAGLTATFRFGN